MSTTQAGAILRDPHARLVDLAVIPGHPARRMAVWWGCVSRPCHHRRYAVVVTANAFRTRHLLPVPIGRYWIVEPAGSRHFALSTGGRRRLVSLRGAITPLHISGSPAPLSGAEIPLRDRRGFVAVDPATGRAHPLSTPVGVVQLASTPGDQLRALTQPGPHDAYLWSSDGGATWHRLSLGGSMSDEMPGLVPTSSDRVHAVALGGDGATLFPLDFLEVSRDGASSSRFQLSDRPKAYGEPLALLRDGRLLVSVEAWSDARSHRPSRHPLGLYVVSPGHALTPVPSGPPFSSGSPKGSPLVLDTVVQGSRLSVYAVVAATGRGAVVTTDDGSTWRPLRAR